ncbi:DUF421 domain-containing protein [Bacillus sp. MCCB 382]|uniref:DUF421 domain-containing protein n=1 Tax=Bacillus sp. MCCB 382 TaxID=2860197 RepID=UPI001C59CC4B|nr:DUF421 domain-containing protein [Bacillus sp. MCCB 382]
MNIWEYIYSPIIIFIASYILLRFAGKKAVSEMNSFDLLFIVVLGTIVSEPLVDKGIPSALSYGLVFTLVYILFSILTLNNKLRWLLITTPTVLVRNGDIDEKGLRKARITTDELLGTLREKGYATVKDIEMATMENMGKVSVIPKSYARPVQPSDLNLFPGAAFIPIPLVMNGQILMHNMKYLKLDEEWLKRELTRQNIAFDKLDDITLASYNAKGQLDIDTDKDEGHNHNPYMYKPGNTN